MSYGFKVFSKRFVKTEKSAIMYLSASILDTFILDLEKNKEQISHFLTTILQNSSKHH